MTEKDRALKAWKKLMDLIRDGHVIKFTGDLGPILYIDKAHYHLDNPDLTFVEQVYLHLEPPADE